jgi:hypothetical protein
MLDVVILKLAVLNFAGTTLAEADDAIDALSANAATATANRILVVLVRRFNLFSF